jgi:membrane associated rhomboid family serine protease
MLADISNNYVYLFNVAKSQLTFMGYLMATLWGVNIVNWFLGSPLNFLGIYPRSFWGLVGIIFAPILHGNFNHLFFNSIPLFVLGMFILMLGQKLFIAVTITLAVTEGLLVWIFGRKAIHIGASGVIAGYFGFILALAYFYPTMISLILGFVTLYYFGSILLGIFPSSQLISWESHLAGLASGVILAYVLWHYPNSELWLLSIF